MIERERQREREITMRLTEVFRQNVGSFKSGLKMDNLTHYVLLETILFDFMCILYGVSIGVRTKETGSFYHVRPFHYNP